MVEWQNLIKQDVLWEMCQTIGALTVINNDREQLTAKIILPVEYEDFADVFSKKNTDVLFEHSMHDLVMETEKGKQPLFSPVYNHLVVELQTLHEYINNMLAKGFIEPSKSAFGTLVLFTKKKDGGLRLCVDYQELNVITLKNRHPLPLIQTFLDLIVGFWFFTKLDIIAAYNLLQIQKNDEWKTAFCCRYGHFEYKIILFG